MEDVMAQSRNARISRRRFLSLTAMATVAASATRVSAQPRRTGSTFISAKTTEAPSLDPILEQALSRQRIDPLFYNRLVEWGHDGKLEPALAESWTTSADGGTGPFILLEWVPQSHLKARKNPDYWDKGKPAVDAIEIKVIPDEANIIAQLRTGNIHHALLEDNKNYLLVKDDKRLRALRSPRLGFDMVNINHGRKPFTDVRVRQALSLAVDRAEVLQAAASGLGSGTGPLTPAMRPVALPVEAFKEWYTPNPERARKLLA